MMKINLNTGLMIASVALGAIGTAASVAASVDQIKNGDRRAAIAGDAAGRAIANQAEENHWFMCCGMKVDSKTGKIIN